MRRYMHQYDIQFLLWHHATLLKSVYLDARDIHNLISCMVISIEYKWEYKCINIPLLLIILLEFSLFYWFLYPCHGYHTCMIRFSNKISGTTNPGGNRKPDNPLKGIRDPIPRNPDNPHKIIWNLVPNRTRNQ